AVCILNPIDQNIFLEGATRIECFYVNHIAWSRQTEAFELFSLSCRNVHATQKLSPRNEVGVGRIAKLVFPEDDLDDFVRRVLDFDAISETVHWLCFRRT